jgi:type 1 glutamine amidotransferase
MNEPTSNKLFCQFLALLLGAQACTSSALAAHHEQPHIAFIIGEGEYESSETMPALAKELEENFNVKVSLIISEQTGVTEPGQNAEDIPEFGPIPNLELINEVDLVVFYVRFRIPPPDQHAMIKAYFDAGKPAVALRTTSHGFWNDKGWFPRYFGGHYKTHTGRPPGLFTVAPAAVANHPILRGVPKLDFFEDGPYLSQPLADTATPLLLGKGGDMPAEPIAYTNKYTENSRIFYTSMGTPEDFERPAFKSLIVNAIFWALGQEIPQGGMLGSDIADAQAQEKENYPAPPPLDAPEGATVLFDGSNLSQWSHWDASVTPRSILIDRRADSSIEGPVYTDARWSIENGAAIARPAYGDIVSKQEFSNYRLHLDFLIPNEPDYIEGRVRGASGVYLGGRYEIELVDSHNAEASVRSLGSILGVSPPTTNAAKPAGTWQSLDVEFHEHPGRKATISAWINGVMVQDNVDTEPTEWAFRPRPTGKPMYASTLDESNSIYRMDTGDFTITLDINTSQTGLLAGKAPLAEKWGFGSKSLYSYGGGIVYFASYEAAQASGGYVGDGKWHHVALVCEGDTAQIFTDGKPSRKSTGFNGLTDNEDFVFRIGDGEQGFIQAYEDHIREVRFYRAVLTEDQIKRLAEGKDADVGDPVLQWKPAPKSDGISDAPVTGPIRLQSDTSHVRFANVWVEPLD